MILKNVHFYNEVFEEEYGDIEIENGIIKSIGIINGDGLDLSGYTVVPGFIDIHIHGANGGDFCDCKKENLDKMSSYLVKNGITSFCPTSMTLGKDELKRILKVGTDYIGNESGAKVVGFNLEGPFINYNKKGAQNGEFVRKGTIEEFNELNAITNKNVKLITIAPESFDSKEFIQEVSKTTRVSIGHSCATCCEARQSFEYGISHATHLFNAMTPMTHREPGIVGAAFDDCNISCELICDGGHISPVVLRNAFKILGENRAIIVSDSMKAAGLKAGEYDLGGQKVFVKENGKYATLSDGTIAASISNVYLEFKNLISFGIDFKTALKSATINPAKAVNKEKEIGSIAIGKDADLVVLDKELNIVTTFLKGEKL